MHEEIIEQLAQSFKQDLGLIRHDLGSLEQAVKEKIQLFGQGLLQRLVDSGPNGYEGSSIACQCGGSMRFVQHRLRDIHTVFGWIKVKRSYYHCSECGKGFTPYDNDSGLGSEQLSPGLAKACCLLAVDDSFQQVSRKLKLLFGQDVCDDTVKQVVHQVGSVAVRQQDQALGGFRADKRVPLAEVNPQRLYVALDGTTVHQTDGWHEVKVGCIYWEDERNVEHKRYVGRFDNSQVFGRYVWLEACRCGFREAKGLVYLGDGAGWIRTEHHRHFSRATFIIDWYHASEHIWDCGKKLFGDGTKATEKWVKKRLDLLWDGWTRRLLNDLKEQAKRYRSGKREAIEALIGYITTNEERMRYDVFRAKGYKIGSGAVEGACKYLVGKRLKQSGMIWSRVGSSAILALRITWLNDRWEQLWKGKPLAA